MEAENKSLAERAEDTVTLNVVTEMLLSRNDPLEIISAAFEKISHLKKIPCLALINVEGEKAKVIVQFYNHPEIKTELKSVAIKKIVLDEILGGGGILLRPFTEADEEVKFEFSNGFKPSFVLLIHSGFLDENEILVILEEGTNREKIKNNIPLFLQIKNFIKWRIENLELLKKIEEQNKLLSQKVEEQTQEINALFERYQALVENSQDAIILHKEGAIHYANKKAAEFLGFEESSELIGKNIWDFLAVEETERVKNRIEETLASKKAAPFEEFKMLDKNGKPLTAEVSGLNITERGETFTLLTIRDLRPRLESEQALRESEERFRKAFHTNPDSININRLEDGLYISVNEGFTKITGWTPEETIGKTSAEINIWQDLNDRNRLVKELKKKGYCKNLEANFVAKDGRVLRGLMSASVIRLNGVPHIISVTRDITSIKRAEEELKFRNKLLTSIFNSLNYPFYIVDAKNYEIILANQAAEKFSKTQSKHCYKYIWGLEQQCDPELCSLEHIKQKNEPYATELSVAVDGRQKYFSIHGYPIFDNENNLVQIIEYVLDITEFKEASEKLKQSELKYRRLFEDAVVGLVVMDGSGKILNANQKACELSGYPKEELLTKNAREFFSEKELKENPLRIKEVLRGEFGFQERNLIRRDGTVVPVELHSKTIGENEIQIFLMDLTDKKKAEEIKKKSEEQFKKIFTMSPVGIVLIRQGKIVFANQSITKLFAAENPEELIGRVIFDFIHPDFKEIARKRMKFLVEHPGTAVRTMEEKIIDLKGNVKDVLIVGHNIELDGKPTIQGYMYDITERNKILRDLQEAKEKAQSADKLKSEFLAQVSHEIRTPLNVILNYTNLLREELAPRLEGSHDFVFAGINKNSKRIIRTIDMILNMSEISLGTYSPSPKNFDLHDDVLFGLYYTFKQYAAEKGVDLLIEKKANNCIIKKDHYSVSQIFEHLLDNAVKFTEDGHVKITIDRDESKRLFVEIKDTGIGIPPSRIENLFQPFEQEFTGYTRKYEGAGLGLSIVKSYCELNEAEIKIDSDKNQGTTVRVTFN